VELFFTKWGNFLHRPKS